MAGIGGRPPPGAGDQTGGRVEQLLAISCSGSPNPPPAAFPRLDAFASRRSGVVGPPWTWLSEPCASWPAVASDRYTGPWNRRTVNPVLVIGDTYDPIDS